MYILRCEGWASRFELRASSLRASGSRLRAKHFPRPDLTEPRAGCVIDTGVLKLTVSASAAGLSGTCKACRCGGCFARRVHAGTVNAPAGGGGIFQAQPRCKNLGTEDFAKSALQAIQRHIFRNRLFFGRLKNIDLRTYANCK